MRIVTNLYLLIILVVGLVWISMVGYLWLKKKKRFVYLVLFTMFFVYVVKVLDYTLFQFQSLILLKHFMPGLMLQGQEAGKTVNLIPLITLTSEDLVTSFLNILLFVPFGFGLPFIAKFRIKKIVLIGLFFSISIELLQFVTGLMAKMTFRIADINDVIFNTIGVVVGCAIFVSVIRIYRRIVGII